MNGLDSGFEQDIEKRFASLSKKLERIENKIQRTMYSALNNPETSARYWNAVRRELDALYTEMNAVFTAWAEKNIPERYIKSIGDMMAHIRKNKNIVERASRTFASLKNTRYINATAQVLYEDAIYSFVSASETGKRNMYRLTRLTQQRLIDESLINTAVGDLAQGASIGMVTNEIEQALLAALEGKRFVQAGKYKYSPSYYAQMVARTKFHDAQAQACVAVCGNYGTDLVLISSHNTTTKICLDFEGKVFSLSGNDKRFPPLDLYTPFHPNCLHLMYPQFASAMEATGTLDKFVKFSNGETSTPPYPKGFIPADKRKAV